MTHPYINQREIDSENWIAQQSADKLFTQLFLPGTHHSATFKFAGNPFVSPFARTWAQCQDLSLTQQLCTGIRFLDIRLAQYKQEMYVSHSMAFQPALDVFLELKAFLVLHPREIIVLHLRQDWERELDLVMLESAVEHHFGPLLVRRDLVAGTLGEIWASGRNLVIKLSPYLPAFVEYDVQDWMFGKWYNESDSGILVDRLRQDMQQEYTHLQPPMRSLEAIITPTSRQIALYYMSLGLRSSLKDMQKETNQRIWELMNEKSKMEGFNLFLMDRMDEKMVDWVVAKNFCEEMVELRRS